MIALARSEPEVLVRPEQLDADPMSLNVDNGTIDLRTARLDEHSRASLCTKLVPIAFDPEAQCPRWLKFLDEVFAGDATRVDFVQRWFRYSLTGLTSEQCLPLLIGSGSNGKTTLLEMLRLLLGEYAVQSDFSTFLAKAARGPRNDLARLFGARVVTSSEAGEDKRLDESLIKQITGDEVIAARKLYQESFEYQPTFKVWLAANHRPVIRETDLGIWRRIRLIPFDVVIQPARRDKDLRAKLTAELSGILGWALDGCLAWQRDGLGTPAIVQEATDEYRVDSDVLGAFLEECCERAPHYRENATMLYDAYRTWTDRNGVRAITSTAFGRKLKELGYDKEKIGRVARIGLRLRTRIADGLDGSGPIL